MLFHIRDCSLCAVIDVLADERTDMVMKTSVRVVVVNVRAAVVIDSFTGITFGADIDMLVCVEIIGAAVGVIVSEVIASGGECFTIGDSIVA